MTTDPIAAARALIEPLTGYTPGPWGAIYHKDGYHIGSGRWIDDSDDPDGGYFEDWHICKTTGGYNAEDVDARLIAAAPGLVRTVATLADAVEAERAKVAAAYEAAHRAAMLYGERHSGGPSSELTDAICARIRTLTPADARAALDKLLAEARLEGWRAGIEAAADHCWAKRDLLADAERKQIEAGLTGRDNYGRRLEAELLSRSIRAMPEPKEASHDD